MKSVPTDSSNQLYRPDINRYQKNERILAVPCINCISTFLVSDCFASCYLRNTGYACLRWPAFPRVLAEASRLSKLDFTCRKGKNSPDYTEEVYVGVICWEVDKYNPGSSSDPVVLPEKHQLLDALLLRFRQGEYISSAAVEAPASPVPRGQRGGRWRVLPSVRNGKTKQLSLWKLDWSKL